jgi:hypothetical protein
MSSTRRWSPLVAILVIALTVPALAAGPGERPDAASASAAFEALKRLAGSWESESTKGWAGTMEMQAIAGGSAILATSEVDPHSGETMATVYHLDGERLLLTHYCVAGNQPRLEATAISTDGRRIELSFKDGGNLPSRDLGHMDRVLIEIEDANRWSSRWTWYQQGEERWLEEIRHVRVADGP